VLDNIQEDILSAIGSLDSGGDGKVVLIIDGLDALLAAVGEGTSVGEVEDMVMGLREVSRIFYFTSQRLHLGRDQVWMLLLISNIGGSCNHYGTIS